MVIFDLMKPLLQLYRGPLHALRIGAAHVLSFLYCAQLVPKIFASPYLRQPKINHSLQSYLQFLNYVKIFIFRECPHSEI